MLKFLLLALLIPFSIWSDEDQTMNPDGYIGGFSLGLDFTYKPETTVTSFNNLTYHYPGFPDDTGVQEVVSKYESAGVALFVLYPANSWLTLNLGADILERSTSGSFRSNYTNNSGPDSSAEGISPVANFTEYAIRFGFRYHFKPN